MPILKDNLGQPYIQWRVTNSYHVRAWIQRKSGDDDWAGTKRYLNVDRCNDDMGNSNGNPTVFPVFHDVPDDQVLRGFELSVCAVTGCVLSEPIDA
jgi:hypothetical protein